MRLFDIKWATIGGCTTIDNGAASSIAEVFNLDIATTINGCTAPGAMGKLAWCPDPAPKKARASTPMSFLIDTIGTALGCIGCSALPDPKTKPERRLTPRRASLLAPDHLAGTDEGRGTLELL